MMTRTRSGAETCLYIEALASAVASSRSGEAFFCRPWGAPGIAARR